MVLVRLILITFCFVSVIKAQPVNPGAKLTANTFTDTQTIDKSASNVSPGTTRHMSLRNAGSHTWIDVYFGSTLRSAIGFDNSGNIYHYQSGANGTMTYNCNPGLSSCSFSSYNNSSTFTHYGLGAFGSGIIAGGSSGQSSTLENRGSLENASTVITSNTTLTSAYTNVICDASTNSCTGTPTRSCSYWTNSTDCALRNSHGGCSWFAGYDCSAFNYESGMSQCTTTSGCNASTSSCSGASDESTCLSQDDSYGGSCSWNNNPTSCSAYDNDQMSCESYSSYCTWTAATYSDCSAFNGDQTTCESYSGQCTWSDPDCTGTYISSPSSCTGTIDNYSCDGTYYTGECTGNYGANCSGTPTCNGITNSTDCGNELGCSWSTAITLTMPSLTSSVNGREYAVINGSSTNADCILAANTGQDINGASTYTLSNFYDTVILFYHELTASCTGFSEEACTPSGCYPYYPNCSWNTDTSSCDGGGSCSGYGDESSCNSATYYDGCQGNYISAKRWWKKAS